MKILCVVRKDFRHHIQCVSNMVEGIKKHGNYLFHEYTYKNPPKGKYDLSVSWGIRNGVALNNYSKYNIIIENAPLNNIQGANKEWVSCGWNGLMGHADFCNENSSNDRWKKHFDDGRLLNYSDGDYILIPLQIKTDMSIAGKGYSYQTIVNEIRKFTDLPIKIKQHPTADDGWGKFLGKNISYIDRFMPIKDAIKGAKVVVTINSNAGVDAVLGGKPVIAIDKGSMAYDIAQHDFTNLHVPKWPDRTQWCNNIAYAQWSPKEVKGGEAWDHLKQKLFTNTQT